ncbi:uncharacterized protein LOC127095751 [Lathyrus oleraceus]|uniref:uncharacterized protein LOC127095751 n=1 Tax=Pisum sativum TaxID=3888 RepID=UPI0021D039D2|nr:uncharacterized protein LOC127095751 [Pisum sativum]
MVVKNAEASELEEGPETNERWALMFDGAANAISHGIGAVLMSPKNFHLPFTAKLCFTCTNNMVEYEACILGLEEAIELKIRVLEVFGDSALVIHQIRSDWETRHANLIPYRDYVLKLLPKFDNISFSHIPQEENQMADVLATLASMYKLIWLNHQPNIEIKRFDKPAHCLTTTEESDDKPWFFDIKQYLEKQEYPAEASSIDKRTIQRLALKFFLNGDVLYKRNYDMVLLRCMEKHEANQLMKDIHEGSFGTHANGHVMAKKILRADYYWLPMEADYYHYTRTCYKCQIYVDKVHVPPTLECYSITTVVLYVGFDMIRMIEPKTSNGHRFILVAIDYFTKWVEAASYANVTKHVVARFLKNNIICRYGIPSKIITDNGSNLNNKIMEELWVTPFSLVYGMEAVLPIEVEIPSMIVLMEAKLDEMEWVQARFDELNLIEKKRLKALCYGQLYQRRLKKAFNKKAFPGGALILATMDDNELPLPTNVDVVKKYFA